jgi:4-diphosphocytidyl-2-C-methyl-D-erythritol kinase
MILFPNAKINIGLDIVSRRADGYHNISTLFYPIPWKDILEIVPAKGEESTLTVTGRKVDCPAEKNLVMKAYRKLNEVVPLPPVDIFLHKVIPDGAGLGGGSADAAFTLVGLNRLFELGLTDEQLAEVAAEIGADCPFFIYNKPMLAEGIGNEFSATDLDLSSYTIAVIKPEEAVSTKEAYAGVTPEEPKTAISEAVKREIGEWKYTVKNDFERSIFPNHPVIAEIKQHLYDMGAIYASMSGSGSSVYGIFSDSPAKVSPKIDMAYPKHDTIVGQLLV